MSTTLGSLSPHFVGALINLGNGDRYVHWGFIQMSMANVIVIILMVVVFALAIVLPFPHRSKSRQ